MVEKVLTVCPYCGGGCKLNLIVENHAIISAEPADGRTNEGTLCLKGYYGWDFLNDTRRLTKRLTKPLLKKSGEFVAVSWKEAIHFTANRLQAIKDKYGPDAIMVAGSARGPGNEANYVLQKFTRAVLGTNNIDHCARLCHAPSVAGLAYTLGNGAMSNSIPEIEDSKCLFIFGYNAAESHPVVARRIIKAKEKGARIIVTDPRYTEAARIADLWLPINNGTNMALVNACANVLIMEGLYNKHYVANYTEGFEEYKVLVSKYTPEYAEKITGVPAMKVREAMRMYAAAPSAFILWGMGVTQFGQAVDVVKGLSGLALLTGNYGRPNVGVGPVRGQNNVQGTCDMGVLPNLFPGYQSVTDAQAREKFQKAWKVETLSANVGYDITQVPELVDAGKIKAYYIMGEDPAQSDPDVAHLRHALDKLELVIVQDIFMNKTALHADVILPATSWGEHEGVYSTADRGFQQFRKAVEPKGDVKTDWEIISLIAKEMGYQMQYADTKEIWTEMIGLCPMYAGATYQRLEELGGIQWPCPDEKHPGTPYLYSGNRFNTVNGKGKLFAVDWRPPLESPDQEYPFILCTVREISHYSVRTMTGNCVALQQLADEPGHVQMSIEDSEKLGVEDQELVWVSSRRGRVISRIMATERVRKGAVYMTYHWWIGACNELTINHLDPVSKTPEYKHCAVKVEKIDDQRWAEQYVVEEYAKIRKQMLC
ncbi:formate dehydrogenase major subunit [Sporomusaceae bacterium BoRhaA]|uniref:formate dehydrogenase subunit alpha n=1 Tax=Pelorhabdus rhamnosifermentans TaxID=2772457 RepID=UPI001C0604FA|nr:formate dehydrogenase subunit alpha [Pelorhabdus rhamnosifermentans]MBU2703108.1 formate dehydrogenase major subunit [Pelorhabdus rhamnosifermentans]